MIEYQTFEFASAADGLRIRGSRWETAAAPVGSVVIAHGAAEHALRYERFASLLVERGFQVWAADHRGHGRSPGPKGLGDFGAAGWDGLVADLAAVVERARAAQPGRKVALFGHSMGSFAAQQYGCENSHRIDALVLSGSTAVEPTGGDPLASFRPNRHFEPARTPYDWLSRDPVEVDKYVADPLCGIEERPFDPRVLRGLLDPGRFVGMRTDLPILLLAGDRDPLNRRLTGLHELEERYRAAGVTRIDTRYYPGGRHEMLNETNRDEVMADLLAWLEAVLV